MIGSYLLTTNFRTGGGISLGSIVPMIWNGFFSSILIGLVGPCCVCPFRPLDLDPDLLAYPLLFPIGDQPAGQNASLPPLPAPGLLLPVIGGAVHHERYDHGNELVHHDTSLIMISVRWSLFFDSFFHFASRLTMSSMESSRMTPAF